MLTQLSIQNYALIDDLKVSFSKGFTTITGETGAGKSILLEGLALVLGSRADRSSFRDENRKCIIEAHFNITQYRLRPFFDKNDLDYEDHTILRREVHPTGKSRAFVNDSPVTLDILTELGKRLIDVHSQHQTLQLTEQEYQLKLVDALADNEDLLLAYEKQRNKYRESNRNLEALLETQKDAIKEKDYNTFLLEELEAVTLRPGLQEELEEEHEQLIHVETILEQLDSSFQLLNDERVGIHQLLRELRQAISKISTFGKHFSALHDRLQSVIIEVDDLSDQIAGSQEQVEANPGRLEEVGNKLQQLYDLQKKHQAANVEELLQIREDLSRKVAQTLRLDDDIAVQQKELEKDREALQVLAHKLSLQRNRVLPELKEQLEVLLHSLGMPNASFDLALHPAPDFKAYGKDILEFLFSANKGGASGELKKVASGGELSRIMLAIKSILVRYEPLPTMMFDEIDTGVSGEISNQMGEIMLQMSSGMQIFAITHLPQVASKGDQHYKVYKEDDGEITHTGMRELTPEERIVELAEMLGGKTLSDSALAHARQLLN